MFLQRDARDCVTVMAAVLWIRTGGIVCASLVGGGLVVTSPWKLSAQMARTMKEVCILYVCGNSVSKVHAKKKRLLPFLLPLTVPISSKHQHFTIRLHQLPSNTNIAIEYQHVYHQRPKFSNKDSNTFSEFHFQTRHSPTNHPNMTNTNKYHQTLISSNKHQHFSSKP